MNEIDLTEILEIAQDGEVTLKDMSNYVTIMSGKWRVKANASVETSNVLATYSAKIIASKSFSLR
jgi:hypothetical protein